MASKIPLDGWLLDGKAPVEDTNSLPCSPTTGVATAPANERVPSGHVAPETLERSLEKHGEASSLKEVEDLNAMIGNFQLTPDGYIPFR